jgi:hypothetical protein
MKAVQCGRIDLKSAPYDTILLKRRPSWLEKDCLEFGPAIYPKTIPFSKILHEVHLEAVLWGIGTALGELPPYFISRAGYVCIALLFPNRFFCSSSMFAHFFCFCISCHTFLFFNITSLCPII